MDNREIGVLLIEDNPGDVLLIREMLSEARGAAYRVKTAAKLAQGMEILGGGGIDILLLDLGLPDSQGLDTLSRVTEKKIGLPIIVLTGLSDERTGVRAIQAGAQDYLLKGEVSPPLLDRTILYAIERKEALDKVRRAKEEWERTFDAMPEIITLQDREMRIVRANRAAHAFFKVRLGELCGRYCYDIFRGESKPCLGCPELVTIHDKACHQGVIAHERLGKIFHVSTSSILDDRGELEYLVHIAQDITEQKRLEEELFQAHKLEALGTLAGGIAHDFNNILMAILGYTDLAMADLPAESPIRDHLEQVMQGGNRAKELVRQLLNFCHKRVLAAEEGEQPILNPSPVVKEAMKMLRASLPSTIEIRKEIDPECGYVVIDPTNLYQIIVNLCTNAVSAMPDGKGVITVRLAAKTMGADESEPPATSSPSPGHYVELAVMDTGVGIDHAIIERIFDPYFTTKDRGKGTGLGLATVQGIVKDAGGGIMVESEVGKGSTFRVLLPLYSMVPEQRGRQVEAAIPRGSERLIVVDDEHSLVEMLQQLLEGLGYRVVTATSGQQALDLFLATPGGFDLVITDQTMPGMTGAELAEALLKVRPTLPIILHTGYSNLISEEQARAIGIKGFAMKPMEFGKLAGLIREVLAAAP